MECLSISLTPRHMQFTLTGFSQEAGSRVFAYEGVGEDRVRVKFTVSADLTLCRKYGIRLQELPLICLEILERSRAMDDANRNLVFTEEAMTRHAEEIVAERDAMALKRASSKKQKEEGSGPVV
jgi:hypothetical protein